MKSKILLIVAMLVAFASCKKDEYVFDKTPDERLSEVMAAYQTALTSSAAGWKATLQPALGGIYNFHLQFNDQNRVSMFADIDTATAHNKRESSYRLKALQQPSLIFDTYSYIHMLSDPDPSVNGGVQGAGLVSDFEFAIESANTDSIVLIGRQNKTKLKLEKASQADLDAWQNGFWLNLLSFLDIQKIEEYFKQLNLGGTIYEISVDPVNRTMIIQWLSGVNLQRVVTPYYLSSQGIMLVSPVSNGSQAINQLSNFSWNPTTKTLQLNVGALTGTIAGATAPLKADLLAPKRWWQSMADEGGEWRSMNGFHINGVDDAYNLRGIKDFVALALFPEFRTQGGITYDLAGYLMVEDGQLTLSFGTAFGPPTFTPDGRIFFGTYLGDLGDIPDDAIDPYVNTAIKFMDPAGYYLVQVGEKAYDMVSVADSKVWVNWFTIY